MEAQDLAREEHPGHVRTSDRQQQMLSSPIQQRQNFVQTRPRDDPEGPQVRGEVLNLTGAEPDPTDGGRRVSRRKVCMRCPIPETARPVPVKLNTHGADSRNTTNDGTRAGRAHTRSRFDPNKVKAAARCCLPQVPGNR